MARRHWWFHPTGAELDFFGTKKNKGAKHVKNGMDGNGQKQAPFHVKIWFIMQLKQPGINGCFRFQVYIIFISFCESRTNGVFQNRPLE